VVKKRKHTLQPADVLLLLLDGDIVRNHSGKLGVDAAVLNVTVPEALEVLIKVLKGRAGVEALAIPVLLGGLGLGELGLGEVRDFLDLEHTVLDDGLDEESTVVGLLNGDVDTGREAGVGVVHFLVTLLAFLEIHLIGQRGVIEVFLLTDVLDVGDGEADADAERSNMLASRLIY
jgi:hypothetical protein